MRLLLLPLLLLCALVARAGDGGDLAITAPGTIWMTDDKVLFAWKCVLLSLFPARASPADSDLLCSTGKSTFTVRMCVHSLLLLLLLAPAS